MNEKSLNYCNTLINRIIMKVDENLPRVNILDGRIKVEKNNS